MGGDIGKKTIRVREGIIQVYKSLLLAYRLMGGDIGKTHLGSERELYKFINHYAVVRKASSKIILVQVYIIFALDFQITVVRS